MLNKSCFQQIKNCLNCYHYVYPVSSAEFKFETTPRSKIIGHYNALVKFHVPFPPPQGGWEIWQTPSQISMMSPGPIVGDLHDNSVILAMPIKSNWYNKYQPRTQCQLVTPGVETRVNPPTLWSAWKKLGTWNWQEYNQYNLLRSYILNLELVGWREANSGSWFQMS